ncbi:MAG: hypothetical protein U9N85_12640 [Bacteroidota bacterium]|nr:hypothetical protein [Bacteroidota bacterium]
MKRFALSFFFTVLSLVLYAQVGGISNSKLVTYNTSTVAESTIEFEPVFGMEYSSYYWDNSGELQPMFQTDDSIATASNFCFRFSYGLTEVIELGLSTSVDVGSINLGIKYQLPSIFEKVDFGLLSGFNLVVGNQIRDKKIHQLKSAPSFVAGFISSYSFSDKLSLDFDFQYQDYIYNVQENYRNGLFLNSDIGYYVTDGFKSLTG